MSVKVTWDQETVAVVGAAYEALLSYHLDYIAPCWCKELLIGYDAHHDGDSSLFITGHPEYRWARMTICPASLSDPVARREEQLVHELFHLPLETIHHEHNALKGFIGKEMLGYAEEQWRRAWEGAVCDLTETYLKCRRMHG